MNFFQDFQIKKINFDGPWLLVILFCFAFGIRLIYLTELSSNPLFDVFPQAMDHSNFDEAAFNLANGDWLAQSANNSFSPLYKYFLGILYWISNQNYYFVYLVQFGLGAGGSVLTFLIGRSFFGRRAGFIAFLGLALFSTHIIYEGLLLRASFISFLGLWSFYLLMRLTQKPLVRYLIGATLVLSLFFQARPNTLLCLPAVGFYLHTVIWKNHEARLRLKNWLVFSCVLLGSFIPLLVQCYLVHGKFVFFDTSGPHTFISGNLTSYSGVGFDLHVVEDYQAQNILGYGSNIHYLISHITGDFWGFIQLYLRKLFFFFNDFEAPTNISVYLYREYSHLFFWLGNHYALFSTFGITGIVVALRRREPVILLYGYTLFLSLAIIIFLNESRYRIPVVPYFIIFGGYTISFLIDCARNKRFRELTAVLTASSILIVCFQEIDGLRRVRPDDFNNMAYAWGEKGQIENAKRYLDRGLELYPQSSSIHFNKGLGHFIQTEWSSAIHSFEQALQLDPSMTAAQHRLTDSLFKLSKEHMKGYRFAKAAAVLERLTLLKPQLTGARSNLGICYAGLGQNRKAREQFLKVLEIEPGHSAAKTNLQILDSG